MKKLFAIPPPSLSQAFTILITLVVCLAGFTEAEIHSDNKKEDSNLEEENNFLSKESSFKESNRRSLEASNAGNDELKQNYFAYLKNVPEFPLENLNDKYSDNFGEPDESDGEKENDGYSFDEDEYYHYNYKRNDQNKKIENNKLEKAKLDGSERKDIPDQNYYAQNSKGAKDNDKNNELKTIEMLNFKEYHPNIGSDVSQNSIQNQKQFSKDIGHKKIFSSEPLNTLNVVDLKENSAIDETLKDRRDEKSSVPASVPSDSKIVEVKKSVKTTDERESAKLKDTKASEESVKKDKEVSLKEGKEIVSAKKLKDSSKTSEEKEKSVQLTESAKLEENVEKTSSNNQESDNAKLTKEDKDVTRFANKVPSDAINPKEVSQINNRANYEGNEYKESLDNMKIPESQINEKNSEEMSESEKNVDFNNFSQSHTEKQYNSKITEKNENYEGLNEQNDLAKIYQDEEKSSYFSGPVNYEFQQDKPSELYKKRESWKPGNNMQMKNPQQPILLPEQSLRHDLPLGQQSQQPMLDLSYDSLQKQNLFQNMDNNLPTNELESTDYYKNYLKSLRKYKNQNDNSRNINLDLPPSGYNLIRKMAFRDKTENKKKKRSKQKKRKLLLSEEMSQEKQKEPMSSSNIRKNSYKTQNALSSQSEKSVVPARDPQLSPTKANKEDAKLAEGQKREQQLEGNRLRRKSPLKLEYEIKVINQSPQDQKNAMFSRFYPIRLRKDVKTKLDDKYLKKYPYSQVNRDDLTGLNTEFITAKKYKRKAPVRKRYSQKSIRTRAAPSGYYSNRVKFGQKSLIRNNEKTNSNVNIPLDINKMSSSNFNSEPANIDKNYPSIWESKQPSFNGDEDADLKEDTSLFLVKKGERTAKAFEDGASKPPLSDELDPDQLAKILSKANDYVVLKKTDNKFRKISNYEPSSFSPSDFVSFPLYDKKTPFVEQFSPYNLANNLSPVPFDGKNLRTRSSNPRKDEKKYSATFRSSTSKSNLKKTLDKFKDLADFFKDNEQESTDNPYSAQEAIEGRDIVFSEDKLPDPIVISNDGSEKLENLNQKPQNSIYSISTNFKNLDMSSKKNEMPNNNEENKDMFTAGVKPDNSDMSFSPALKTLFPEASSINSMTKNGNEIIVLDFNHNRLKPQQGFRAPQKLSQEQSYGTFNPNNPTPSMNPLNFLGERKVKFILDSSLSSKAEDKSKNGNSKNQLNSEQNKNYVLASSREKQPTMTNSLEYNELPSLLKNLIKKNVITFNTKTVRKKSKGEPQEKNASEYYKQFRTDLGYKNSYTNEHYNDPSEERNIIKVNLPSSSFSELSGYSGVRVKQLGSFLQNLIPKEYSTYTGNEHKSNSESYKNSKEYQNIDSVYQDTMKCGIDYSSGRPSQWLSSEEKKEDEMESISKEVKDDVNKIISDQEISDGVKEKNYDQLRKQIENVSDEIRRLRREEMEKKNLAKTKEQTVTLNKECKAPDMKFQEQDMKTSPDFMNPNDLIENEGKDDKDSEYQTLKRVDEPEENPEEEESLDSDYDSHLSELFENLSKNSKNPSESTWQRQKRFSRHDLEDKVSKTEVQNTILKNLPEDNYQSVYSPGIKRRLLSIENEAENADADEHDKNTGKETQENCERNAANNCVDPIILELFGGDGYEEGKIRERRSLTSHFHTNFKREIDLDESMPNDFQNFLVTSLGGVGSEKREVAKKDEALWGGKESSQNNYNQIVESSSEGKETSQDSALEKREVSPNENRKTQGLSKSDYYSVRSNPDSNFADMMNSFKRAEKKIRSDGKSKVRSKSSEFVDEKLPTQIRIQITNGSSKEKKSSKPIMDESETSSTDVENLPKEKEFFDKNKINPLLSNNLPKFHQVPKNKFSYGEFKEDESKHLGDKQKAYHSYQRRKRKKKKFVPENPMKPVKDFITFDQKAMESLLKRYKPNQNLMPDQTTQKIPVSHPLPQVETVYNPTQDTNKAQLEMTRLGKINSITNKNTESSKNSLRANDASTYDDGIIRSYLKLDKMKSNEEGLKEFEDVEWKPYSRKMGFRQRPRQENHYEVIHPTQEVRVGSPPTYSSNVDSPVLNSYFPNVNMYGQMAHQTPHNRFFYHTPSPNVMNNQFMYDVLKLKQQIKNKNPLNVMAGSKPDSRPYYFYDKGYKQEDKDKAQNLMTPYLNTGDRSWNYFDYYYNKNLYPQRYRMKDYYPYMTKNTNQIEPKTKNHYSVAKKFLKNLNFDKLLNLDNQSPVMDNYRDIDYLDTTDDYYLDEYPSKDSHLDELLEKDILKKPHLNKFDETQNYYQIKIPEVDDGLNEDDDELEEDYEENSDEEDLDDYSLLTNSNLDDLKLMKNFHGTEKLQNYLSQPDIFANRKYYNPDFEGHGTDVSKFISSLDDKLNLGVADIDFKSNLGPIPKSSILLQKANENSRVFGKNVLNNIKLSELRNNDAWNHMKERRLDKISGDWQPLIRNDLKKKKFRQEKLKRSQCYPIGSRLFYAAKTEINNARDLNPLTNNNNKVKDNRSKRRSNYKTPLADSFHVQFAGLEDGFDNESEQNEGHIGENLMMSEKTQKEVSPPNENEDIKENLESEDDAQDNYLENIIGKYIMRKTINPLADSGKASATNEEQWDLDNSVEHKIKKRSTQKQKYAEKQPKFLRKRLSSGHLTENNFRKYHKKNFSRKRNIKDADSCSYKLTALIKGDKEEQNVKKNDRQVENEKQKKRSALDLFKKITNKDRENKKAENSDGRTAGFEPLLSLTDKKSDRNLPLVQVKKSASESFQGDTKGNPPELKAHYPNEGQHLRAQLNEKKSEKNKEALKDSPTSSAQGPWKIDLNDKYESKATEHPDKEHRKSFKSPKMLDTKLSKGDDDSLKAFLVISKNTRRIKRSFANDLFPVSGPHMKQVPNSYLPQSGVRKTIYKKQVRESSLAPMKSETSADRILKSHLNEQKGSGALHSTKYLFESRAFNEPKANIKKNGSFVTANEQCKNSGLLSKERLTKSVFSPMSDANIIRNSRNINEETSEYLGQRIVDAILFHVNANPKLKQLIAPGLTMRTTAFKEDTDYNKKRALHQVEFSEQLQAFFKKFMFDLEKMTEKHVKKRMCHEIDKKSKRFLQSLLIAPINKMKEEEKPETKEEKLPSNELRLEVKGHQNPGPLPFMTTAFATPQRINSKQTNEKLLELQQSTFEKMPAKHKFLLKLNNNYQIPPEVEKVKKEVLMAQAIQELPIVIHSLANDQTSRQMKIPNNQPFLIPIPNCPEKPTIPNDTTNNNPPKKNDFKTIQLKMFKKPAKQSDDQNSTTTTTTISPCEDKGSENQLLLDVSESSSSCPNTESPNNNTSQSESVFYFTEIEDPNKFKEAQSTTPNSPFEIVDSVNDTETSVEEKKNEKNLTEVSKCPDVKDGVLMISNFGLLPPDNTTIPNNIFCNNEFLAEKKIHENVDEKRTENFNIEDYLLPPYDKPIELHKPSSDNTRRLQSSLQNQNSRVKLETLKRKTNAKASQPLQRNTDRRIFGESRNPRSLIVPGNGYSTESRSFSTRNNWNDKAKYFYSRPVFPYRVDKKFNTPKVRPFEKATQYKWPTKNQPGPLEYLLRKDSLPNCMMYKRHRHGKPLRGENFYLRKRFGKKRKKRIPHFLIHRPKGAQKHQHFQK